MTDLFTQARACLEERDPQCKVGMTLEVARRFGLSRQSRVQVPDTRPLAAGRPDRPELVHYSRLPRRRLTTAEGRRAFLHALAHIEFNAINLAWDAVCRFPGMPADYYRDWSHVAGEEALHFGLLTDRLLQLGCRYGDFPAHNGLWEMAEKTAHDVLVRMALVPRVLEARGLDVTPGMLERLKAVGDRPSMAILERILADEIGHVKTGSRWFEHLCRERGLEPVSTFARLLAEHGVHSVKPPLNRVARRQAGFSNRELEMLEHWTGGHS
jgi:uncharacterized ferritin-like protein (DUF455 family)